ncbi:transposase DNA-binding-containing protein [Bradyrhizobium sp. DN5]|uniref:IS4/Tn5 family transposase DNA-binding protein n=1 Tax=Bradyrhizobium sp. DN5 TaxID=3056950 RepID=UPI0035252165
MDEREIDKTAFKAARLGRRFSELLKQIGDGMGGSIPFARQDWANTKAAYRFFANECMEEANILSGHFAATRARVTMIVEARSSLFRTRRNSPTSARTRALLA